jgi:hypothetical protein
MMKAMKTLIIVNALSFNFQDLSQQKLPKRLEEKVRYKRVNENNAQDNLSSCFEHKVREGFKADLAFRQCIL